MNEKTVSEIIAEYDIHIYTSDSGGYVAKSRKLGIILKAETLKKLLAMVKKAYG